MRGRTQVKHHSERGVSDLSDDAAVAFKGGLGVPQCLCGFDCCNDIIDRAIEFLFGIRFDLTNLPHEHFHDCIALGFENLNKFFHCGKSCLIQKATVSELEELTTAKLQTFIGVVAHSPCPLFQEATAASSASKDSAEVIRA
jgi:hypothetical protein